MFKGAITALVTPFDEQGNIDEPALRALVDAQIEAGIDGLVPCGTTGESPTLSHEEHRKVVEIVVNQTAGRVPVIAGTGSNSTQEAIELTKAAKEAGADGSLQVCPYYNKPTQEGLYRHFSAIAKAVDIPLVIYNIKGRTAINMTTETLARLAKDHSNIVAVKEASGDINQMQEVLDTLPTTFSVLSGDDNMVFDLMKRGGKGVISVASNLIPKQMHEFTKAMLEGNVQEGKAMSEKLMPVFKAMFIETNPIPIKTALAMNGTIKESFRLPLCEMAAENKEKLRTVLEENKLLLKVVQ